ncbi:MAG: FtsX-like permease family protein [Streptosporangiaceae bacterium]|nr:FtsX-like permease family protein [Streptosporangiaceae bacterium]
MIKTVLASLRYRKARLALSGLAICLGVAFVSGTLVLGASMTQAYFDSFAAGAKNVSAAVSPVSTGKYRLGGITAPSVPPTVLQQVSGVPGVAAAVGRLVGQAPLIGGNGKVITNGEQPGFGINVPADAALRGFTVASGHLPDTASQVVVDKATAADQHFTLGQTVRVVDHNGVVRAFVLVGTIDLGVNHEFGSSTVTGFQTPAGLAVTGRPGYDAVVARAAPGVSQAALVARIHSLPHISAYQVQTGSQLATSEANSAVHFTQQFTTVILVFAVIALIVACIVIYNTFTILIAQRGRELALLRCVGASRRQVFRGMLAESAVTGLVASAVGVLAGLGLGWGLQRLFAGFGASIPAGPLVLTPVTVLVSMGAGVLVTVAASLLPARSATRIAPVAALGEQVEPKVTSRASRLRLAVAVLSATLGILLTVNGMHNVAGQAGFLEIAAGGCVCFVAVLALGPLIAPPVLSLFGRLFVGTTARLATANARRNPHRVAATTAALTIGITLMSVFTVIVSSAQASTSASISRHYPIDYDVQPGRGGQSVPPQVIRALQASPKLGIVAPQYDQRTAVNGTDVQVGAIARSALGLSVKPAMVSGTLASVGAGTAAVDSSQLRALRVSQGGTLVLAGGRPVRVTAVYNGTGVAMPDVLLSVGDYVRWFRPSGADDVLINAAPGVPPAGSRAAVDAATASDPLLEVLTTADYRANLAGKVNQVLALFGTLLGLAVLIALFGISNTLTLSVIERTRESALMRALGLTRGQLRRMLLIEAVLMALLAIAVGIGLGAAFGWAMVRAFIDSSGGEGMLSIPYAQIALYAVIGVCAAVAAAVLPARRAARTSVIAAITDN